MKKIIVMFLCVFIFFAFNFSGIVCFAAVTDQKVEILIGTSEEAKYLCAASADQVNGARFADCFKTAIYRFDFPDDTTKASASVSMGEGLWRISLSNDMINWTVATNNRTDKENAQTVTVDLTEYINKNPGKIVFVKCDDPTIIKGAGLDGGAGSRFNLITLDFKSSSNVMNEFKAFDGWTMDDSKKALKEKKDVAGLVSRGSFTPHELFGYICNEIEGDPIVYKFKLPAKTTTAVLSSCIQYSALVEASADNKTWKKVLSAVDESGAGLTVKQYNAAIPQEAISANGIIYIRVSGGAAWHFSLAVVSTQAVTKEDVAEIVSSEPESISSTSVSSAIAEVSSSAVSSLSTTKTGNNTNNVLIIILVIAVVVLLAVSSSLVYFLIIKKRN